MNESSDKATTTDRKRPRELSDDKGGFSFPLTTQHSRWPIGEASTPNAAFMNARDIFWNAQCRRFMQVMKAASEQHRSAVHSGGSNKSGALWRIAENEDALWLCAVWVQGDEHDVTVDVSDTTEQQQSKCDDKSHVLVTNRLQLTEIPGSFLIECDSVTAVDLRLLVDVTSIGDYFLLDSALTQLDVTPLRNVMRVGDYFLSNCGNSSLTALDISRFSNLTSVGDNFLACLSLTALDLSALNSVTFIGVSFLADCESLTELDLSPLSNVTQVTFSNYDEEAFLWGCTGLTAKTVRTSGLPTSSPLWCPLYKAVT